MSPELLSRLSNSFCTDHQCPECGAREHVTVERVVVAGETTTHCYCRVCGHSWHPHRDGESAPL